MDYNAAQTNQLILGASIRLARQLEGSNSNNKGADGEAKGDGSDNNGIQQAKQNSNDDDDNNDATTTEADVPVSHEPCTKPDYLDHANVRYNAANTLLLDDDDDAVMMEWERPLMNAHAGILTHDGKKGKRVLNIGFGLGIIDAALQSHGPSLHVIIEAHPTVHRKMIDDKRKERKK